LYKDMPIIIFAMRKQIIPLFIFAIIEEKNYFNL